MIYSFSADGVIRLAVVAQGLQPLAAIMDHRRGTIVWFLPLYLSDLLISSFKTSGHMTLGLTTVAIPATMTREGVVVGVMMNIVVVVVGGDATTTAIIGTMTGETVIATTTAKGGMKNADTTDS